MKLLPYYINIQRLRFRIPIYFKFMLLSMFLWGCKKVIDVNLNDASPQLVVEGNIYNTPGPYSIQVSKTINYSALNQFPAVSGASLFVKDLTDGITDTLQESNAGKYITKKIQGLPGHSYQLEIGTSGQTYIANTTLPAPVPFDSVSFEKIARPGGKVDWYAVINYQDPPRVNNYYLFTLWVNGRKINNTFAYDDRLTDGRYVSRTLRTDSTYIQPGDTVMVTMNHMGKEGFQYYSSFSQATGNGALQSVSPANPVSNISNKALGYFLAGAIQTRRSVAK